MICTACSKGVFGNNSGVGCQQHRIDEGWTQWWVENTDVCLGLPPLNSFLVAPELTGWNWHIGYWCACLLEARQPTHLLRPLAKVNTQWVILPDSTEESIWKFITSDDSQGAPWFISAWCVLHKFRIGRRKESSELIFYLFFALVIESGTYCYQKSIHLHTSEGSRSCFASISWNVTGDV